MPILCLVGDGGAQFTLPELMVAAQEKLPITFIVWNNRGYREIATAMADEGVDEIGCDPAPPDFAGIAKACALPFLSSKPEPEAIVQVLLQAAAESGPVVIEIDATAFGF